MLHTKYTYKIFKKDDLEAREPAKEANTAWPRKLCYLIDDCNTHNRSLTLSMHNLFGT